MHLARVSRLLILACILVSVLPACQKEEGSGSDTVLETTETTETTVSDCPNLNAEVAHFTSQQAEKTARLLTLFTAAQLADLRANSCLTKDPAEPLPTAGEEADDRASGLKNRFWTPGQTIRVRFLNGSASLQNKTFAWAKEWESYANIHFTKVTSGASEVRVFFGNDGHWSYIGTDNRSIEACEKTMNLDFQENTPTTEIRRVALHEFGHVLGMRHEHQQPLANIPWNQTAVYAYYAQQDWTKEDVNEQVLNKNTVESTQYTAFDAQSIMEYPVSASLTTNGFSIPWNNQLSVTDESYIGMMYSSQRIRVRHAATGYNANITFVLDGIYHTIRPGETMQVPAYTSGNQLAIWEQASGAWAWDGGYTPLYGKNYKLVRVGSTNNLTVAVE